MTTEIECKEHAEQPTLSIRVKTSMEELPTIIGESYMKIVNYITELGEKVESEPFTAYHTLDMQNMDVEMGFPLTRRLPGRGEIIEGTLPKGLVVSCLYKGPYMGMESTYNELFKWIADNQYEPTGIYYEFYYNSPQEVPESELLTRMEVPVTKK